MKSQVKKRIESKDFVGLSKLLTDNPTLANEGITIPFDFFCKDKAHPLHRICDGVINGKITDEEAVRFAKIFLEYGAKIDGDKDKGEGTPLLAAASLHAEQVGIFYVENSADIHYTYKNDGASALHWAAFCGKDKLLDKLIKAGAVVNKQDAIHNSTPLGWALHTLMINDNMNIHNQVVCIKLLLSAGADLNSLRNDQKEYLEKLAKQDLELKDLLK